VAKTLKLITKMTHVLYIIWNITHSFMI